MCAVVFGLGFGVSLLGVPLVFAHFFGRKAFAGTQGTSRMTVGLVRLASPTLTGYLADVTGSYTLPFLGLMAVALSGSAVAFLCPRPAK
jgi:cyanate permease